MMHPALRVLYVPVQWAGFAVVKWIASALGWFVVPVALLLKADMNKLPVWGNDEGILPAWDTSFWGRYKWYAFRNAAHNLIVFDMPEFQTFGVQEDMEQIPGFGWRYRHSAWADSFRIVWGPPRRDKGKREFYIGFKLGSAKDLRFTFFQFRPFPLWEGWPWKS